MKIGEIFTLNKTQHELDFVDVDIEKDKSVFIDPFFLSTRNQPWCLDASRTVKSFFQIAIDLIKNSKTEEARSLFSHLHEPNETCLGLSVGTPKGRGVGDDDSKRIFDSILQSKAVQSGLVDDLEDTAIFIEGIDRDKVSDMTTNIIRKHLIDYTTSQCNLWNIPLTPNVPTGFFWNSAKAIWDNEYADRLVIEDRPLLLVPKIAVSYWKEYTNQKYYQHDILNFLKGEHLKNRSGLVRERTLKDGTKHYYVTKNDIAERDAPYSKQFLREFTLKHPDIFENFKEKSSKTVAPVTNNALEEINLGNLIDYLIKNLNEISPGPTNASTYHKLAIGILELIFYPGLNNPIKEREINEGRKRIDITFDNSASDGYFLRLSSVHQIPSRYIFVECKNYTSDTENPEVDQLSGRFSVNTGKFGILMCRKIENRKLLIARCIDLWKQKNELIIPLSDLEVIEILKAIKEKKPRPEEETLNNLQREVILS